jgi:hypothetical protein
MQEISKYVTRFKFSEYFETSKFSKFVWNLNFVVFSKSSYFQTS